MSGYELCWVVFNLIRDLVSLQRPVICIENHVIMIVLVILLIAVLCCLCFYFKPILGGCPKT